MDRHNMKKHALEYAELGLIIFPCNGKIPITKNGFKDASSDTAVVEKWWSDYPHANIGLVTGKKNGFFVVDIDIKDDGYSSLEKMERDIGKLVSNAKVSTGSGGLHIYFKYPKEIEVKNSTGLLPGIDIRGEGGYVIAPPSSHVSGGRYSWN